MMKNVTSKKLLHLSYIVKKAGYSNYFVNEINVKNEIFYSDVRNNDMHRLF